MRRSTAFDKALAAKPDHFLALANRGIALKGLRRRDEALAAFDNALAIFPDHVNSVTNRGDLLLDMGRLPRR